MNEERHNTEQKSSAKEPTTTMPMPIVIDRLPIPHRIAGFALTATFFIFVLLGLAHHNFRGEILGATPASDAATALPLRSQSYFAIDQDEELAMPAAAVVAEDETTSDSYYIFLQKFPLESSFKMIFHTEVIVCPRETFSSDPTFLNMLDGLKSTISPSRFVDLGVAQDSAKSPFAPVSQDQWSKQSVAGCVQLGYGGANCGTGCCGSPHLPGNRNYALNSRQAVISNAMGDNKELFFYGVSGSAGGVEGISGEDAYKAVCHGHMNAIEMGGLPKCVSNWAGRDYNPLTNNCNTFTSTVLKCVYGLSDAKPHLGVSDLRTVTCPSETNQDGKAGEQCVIPTNKMDKSFDKTGIELSLE